MVKVVMAETSVRAIYSANQECSAKVTRWPTWRIVVALKQVALALLGVPCHVGLGRRESLSLSATSVLLLSTYCAGNDIGGR